MKKAQLGSAMMVIGPSKESIQEARAAIMEILNTEKCGDEPKTAAVKTLARLCSVHHVTVQNCNFDAGGSK